MADESSVKVAVRIRPLVESEISKGCQDILEVYPALEQIRIKNSEKAFTFNYVLDSHSSQSDLYSRCSSDLIKNLFNGYNVTILAYGQTGSGKTYSMGTCYQEHVDMGVIPRAVHHIFEIMRDQFSFDFSITVSFMELYQENLFDLLSEKPRDQSQLDIREDPSKGIVIQGLIEHPVETPDEVLNCLMKGSQGRATGATNMNAHSSRSHAIFTIDITMRDKNNLNDRKTARFTLVDLAGSERFKKTGASGITFKEGVNINKGLLVLGNVISALGDEKHVNNHIPYRDSNLTRLLKDSLGGNSITLMIACVSPADYNLEETLSTLRYADRARKIKNKPIVNQDSKVAEIIELKKTVQQLRLQILGQGDTLLYPGEIDALRKETKEQKEKIGSLTFQLSSVLSDNTCLLETIHMLQSANETLKTRLKELRTDYDTTLSDISTLHDNPDQLKANIEKLQMIQKKITDMDHEQQKTVQEVHKLETTFSIHQNSHHDRQEPSEEIEITEKRALFANKQLALKSELKSISAQLVMKESLAAQLKVNVQNMVNLTVMRETEDKIARLEQEKNELLQQLRITQSNTHSKLAEQRRKRVQELETELQGLKRKIQEQAKLIKMKEKEELKIKRLTSEITAIKQEKVKLIRNMREESERFRMWRLQKDRELAKLKQEDRKKLNQIKKMETLQEKQQNVLKRKVEEVASLNKKLNKAMKQRKLVQEQRLGGKTEKITDWLKNELGLLTNIIEVDSALSDLLEDRAVLQQQLDKIKNDPLLSYDPEQIKLLQDEIEIRSLQIQDSQQKLLDFNEDSDTVKCLWENVHSMVEAKIALRTLWEMIANVKKNEIVSLNANKQLLSKLEELSNHIERLSKQNNILINTNAEENVNLQKDYEERVGALLKRLQGKASNEECEKVISLQLEQNKKLEQECKELNEKLRVLTDNLEKEKSKVKEMPETPLIKIEKTPEDRRVVIRSRNVFNKNRLNLFEISQNMKENQKKENVVKDGDYEEADWRRTPMGKRVMKEKQNIEQWKFQMGMRRFADDPCTCEDICDSSCSCIRSSYVCSMTCKCPLNCDSRRENDNGSYSEENATSTQFGSTQELRKITRKNLFNFK